MKEQLVIVPANYSRTGCQVSSSSMADTWMVNVRIDDLEKYPFVTCDECARKSCYRYAKGKWRGNAGRFLPKD